MGRVCKVGFLCFVCLFGLYFFVLFWFVATESHYVAQPGLELAL